MANGFANKQDLTTRRSRTRSRLSSGRARSRVNLCFGTRRAEAILGSCERELNGKGIQWSGTCTYCTIRSASPSERDLENRREDVGTRSPAGVEMDKPMIPKPLAFPGRASIFIVLEYREKSLRKLKLLHAYRHEDIITRSNPRLQQIHSQIEIIQFQCTS